MKYLNRRSFFSRSTAIVVGGVSSAVAAGQGVTRQGAQRNSNKEPRLDLGMVEAFVRAAHRDLGQVKSLLAEQPALINAAWDWGAGDWETGLGGAAHMGQRDIALHLLDCNARLDIFAAAMLGKVDVVKAAVHAIPGIHRVPGPHGISLIRHAEAGGEHARRVVEYLRETQ